jgi:hypothetical protein
LVEKLGFIGFVSDGKEKSGGSAGLPWSFPAGSGSVLQSSYSRWVLPHQCKQGYAFIEFLYLNVEFSDL